VPPALDEPLGPSSALSTLPEQPERAAIPSAIEVVPHSHREERFLFMPTTRKLKDRDR
jgi:hypothetical protein